MRIVGDQEIHDGVRPGTDPGSYEFVLQPECLHQPARRQPRFGGRTVHDRIGLDRHAPRDGVGPFEVAARPQHRIGMSREDHAPRSRGTGPFGAAPVASTQVSFEPPP